MKLRGNLTCTLNGMAGFGDSTMYLAG